MLYVAQMSSYDRSLNYVFLMGLHYPLSLAAAVFAKKAEIFSFFSLNQDLLEWPYESQSATRTLLEFDEKAFNDDSFEVDIDWETDKEIVTDWGGFDR